MFSNLLFPIPPNANFFRRCEARNPATACTHLAFALTQNKKPPFADPDRTTHHLPQFALSHQHISSALEIEGYGAVVFSFSRAQSGTRVRPAFAACPLSISADPTAAISGSIGVSGHRHRLPCLAGFWVTSATFYCAVSSKCAFCRKPSLNGVRANLLPQNVFDTIITGFLLRRF